MSEHAVQPTRIDPIENLDRWLDDRIGRDAEPGAETGQSNAPDSPAEPTVAQAPEEGTQPEAQAEPDWYDAGLVANHGFLKGRKGPEVEKAFRHAEATKQQAEREAAELRRQLDQMRMAQEAEAAARRVMSEQRPAAQAPTVDEIESAWFENPAKAKALLMQQAEERARNAMREELTMAQEAAQAQQRQMSARSAAAQAVQWVADTYGVDESIAQARVMGTFTHLAAHVDQSGDDSVWQNPNAYAYYVRQLVGDPAPAQVPTVPVPDFPDPPGSKRPSSAPARKAATGSPLRAEFEDAARSIAAAIGNDPDKVAARLARTRR